MHCIARNLFSPLPPVLRHPGKWVAAHTTNLHSDENDLRTYMYTEDKPSANNVVPEDYYNIRPLEFELMDRPPHYEHYGPPMTKRAATEQILMGIGALALVIVLYDGITGAGIISL